MLFILIIEILYRSLFVRSPSHKYLCTYISFQKKFKWGADNSQSPFITIWINFPTFARFIWKIFHSIFSRSSISGLTSLAWNLFYLTKVLITPNASLLPQWRQTSENKQLIESISWNTMYKQCCHIHMTDMY